MLIKIVVVSRHGYFAVLSNTTTSAPAEIKIISTVTFVLKYTQACESMCIWYLTISTSTPAGIKKYLSKVQVLSNVFLKVR